VIVHVIRTSPHWLLLGAVVALCQCGSNAIVPVRELTLQPGSQVAISYVQADGTALTMTNTSGLSADRAHAALKRDPSLKIIPDNELQRVLDVFGGYQYFRFASAAPASRSPNKLVVRTPDTRHVLTSRNSVAEATAAFGHSLSLFLIAYNSNDSYSARKITAEDLKASSKRLNRGAGKRP